MATISLNATVREGLGKGAARKLRATGSIPAVMYGMNTEATSITIDPRALELGFASTKDPNTLVSLTLEDGTSHEALVREVQRHPVSGQIRHVDFFVVHPEVASVMKVPFAVEGRAAGTRVGGTMAVLVRTVDVRCKPADIPSIIKVDVTPLNIGQSLKISEVTPPAGCTFVYRKDYALVEVQGKAEDTGKGA